MMMSSEKHGQKDTCMRNKRFCDAEALRRTAAFVRMTGVSIERLKKEKETKEKKLYELIRTTVKGIFEIRQRPPFVVMSGLFVMK